MKILILVAMDKELALLTGLLENGNIEDIYGVEYHHGNIGKQEVYIGKCGIGKVNSALRTFEAIQTVKPDLVINSGVAGGAGLPVGSLLVADRIAYHDVWCGPGTEYGAADGYPVYLTPSSHVLTTAKSHLGDKAAFGLICSGDKFISTAEEIKFIRSKFPDVQAVDMESASIAQTCISQGIDFSIVRVVSDTPGEGDNISQYQNFWQKAPEITFNAVKTIIINL